MALLVKDKNIFCNFFIQNIDPILVKYYFVNISYLLSGMVPSWRKTAVSIRDDTFVAPFTKLSGRTGNW